MVLARHARASFTRASRLGMPSVRGICLLRRKPLTKATYLTSGLPRCGFAYVFCEVTHGAKESPGHRSDRGSQCVLCCCRSLVQVPHELLKQLRVPQESHLRKLLTAAHTYSLNWSQDHLHFLSSNTRLHRRRGSWPCPAVAGNFESDCRSRQRR